MSNKITSLEKRKAFLDTHYADRVQWSKDRKSADKPKAMVEWANTNFPDREARGLRFCDLKYLDRSAYNKVQNWRRDRKRYPGDTLPDLIGFPTKRAVNDRLIAAGLVPTSAAVNEAMMKGDPEARDKKRLWELAQKRLQKEKRMNRLSVSVLSASQKGY